MKRTVDQKFANELDADFYRLLNRVNNQLGSHWIRIAAELRNVRPLIRQRMSEEDRRNTQ